ncbi:MAG: T9SS type A sorting domain-containing protein [Chitinophagaceae bacterium]|nr:T9SS type A sorting domain-containing protein [Chitinophagaceae bacterium]MBK7557873.1 T9SS type A sorting domain-containing protein [Chitinophagaceae bacterium]MBK9531564.1 T9SS type A sorting domain-containing protein [Chitinophagaceae bacterium]
MKKFFTLLILTTALLFSNTAFSIPKLNSYPTAIATLFLDFDGHNVQSSVWNSGMPFNCAASGMTEPQITEAFYRVAEDYRPFNINITTDSTVFLAAPLNRRMRIIITTTSSWSPGVGGVAFIGSFNWGDDTPAFVFSDRLGPYSPKMIGECISHESGHTVGLSHQSKYTETNCYSPIEQYNSGIGTGETGWAPIMGNSYNRNMSNWNNGPTPYGCNSVQDNLSIIASQNGFGYRTDDYTEALNTSTHTLQGNNFNVNGIITTNTDKDAFTFTLPANSNFILSAIPFNVQGNWIGANLDTRIELYSSPTTLIRDYNPLGSLSVSIDTILNAGTYYLKIYGTGNSNIGAYGSLGAYTISGNLGSLPIHDVSLGGTVIDKNRHSLNWRIIADEPIKTIEVETSGDGSNFKALTTVTPSATKFSYQPFTGTTVFYRLKVTSEINQTVYSNTIALKGTGIAEKLFNVSTLVQNEIIINASGSYRYQLLDMNGSKLASGSGLPGINRLGMANRSKGMYIIQLINNDPSTGNNTQQTERIIKQ